MFKLHNNFLILDDQKNELERPTAIKCQKFPRLVKSKPEYNIDDVVDMVDDLDFDQFNNSFSDEFYTSPEYTPYSNHQSTSDSEIDDNISQKESRSPIINKDEHLVAVVPDDKVLNVDRAKKQMINNQNLIRDKRVFCLYCELLVSNFPRHLERKHALEEDVRVFITLPKKSKERLKHLKLIKNKGNLSYNKELLKKKKGSLIVGRRPSETAKMYVKDTTYLVSFV